MKKCKCYDGPYSSDTPKILVSVRCPEHAEILAKADHSLMLVDTDGKMISSTPREKLKGHQAVSLKNAENARRYGADPHAMGGMKV